MELPMSTRRSAVLLTLFLSLFATSLSAQALKAQKRDGFWISFGMGGGSAGMSCDGCDIDRSTGLSGYLRMGGTISPRLLIGGETNGWMKSESGVDQQIGFLTANAYFYPQATSGFYLKGGVGLASASEDDGSTKLESMGFGMQLGTGYDLRLAQNFSLTPYVNYLRAFGAEAKLDGTGLGENLNPNVLQVGLGFSWH
jgi:hypothetical protein